MTSKEFKVIKGGKVDLEKLLVEALFTPNIKEVDRLSKLLELESTKKPTPNPLTLVKSTHNIPNK